MSTIITVAIGRDCYLSISHHAKVSDAVAEFWCPIKTEGIVGLNKTRSNCFNSYPHESITNATVEGSSVCFVDDEYNCGSITVFGSEHQEVIKEILSQLEDKDLLNLIND